MKHEITDN